MTGYSETAVSLSIIEVKDKAHSVMCHKSVGWGRGTKTLSSTLVLVAGGWQHHVLVPIVQESCVGLRSGLDRCGKSLPAWFKTQTKQPVASCCADYAITTKLRLMLEVTNGSF